jgi:hypothetical protein
MIGERSSIHAARLLTVVRLAVSEQRVILFKTELYVRNPMFPPQSRTAAIGAVLPLVSNRHLAP